jgi:hypothetical protein
LRRALTFHLAQAAMSFEDFREIARLLREQQIDPELGRGAAGPT